MARNTTQVLAQPMPTLTPEALKALIHEVLAEREKNNRTEDTDARVVKAFKRAGFEQVTPRVDTKTFNLWVAEGLRPKEGEKSVKVGSLRLFHRTQCRPLSEQERAQGPTASRLPLVSPVTEPAPATPPKANKGKSKAQPQPQA